MNTWAERKAERRQRYARFVHGWKLVPCVSCSGAGYYDSQGSPRCAACDGTGKIRVPPGDPRLNGCYDLQNEPEST